MDKTGTGTEFRKNGEIRAGPRLAACVLGCLAGLVFNALVFGPSLATTLAGTNDFMGLYPGGRLAGGPAIYDARQVFAVERETVGYANPRLLFCRPPYYAALMWPLGRLPYHAAYLIYQVLMLASAAAFVRWWPETPPRWTALACCWSLPLAAAFAIGQDVPLLLAVIAGALALLKARRDFAAGLLFSLCAIKFHLFLLVPVFIVARRMWRFAGGLAAGGTVLLALAFAAGGAHAFGGFLRTATLPQSNPGRDVMPNLNGLFQGAVGLEIAAAPLVAAAVWVAARRGTVAWALGATLAAGLLTSHHAYVADCAMVLPGALIAVNQAEWRWQRYLALFLLLPLAYLGAYLGPAILITRLGLVALAFSFALSAPAEVPRGS